MTAGDTAVVDNGGIRCVVVAACPFCSSAGRPVYDGLRDHLFGVPGEWSVERCTSPACGLAWLTPAPLPSELHKVYTTYYTHVSETPRGSAARRVYRALVDGYIARRYGRPARALRLAGLLLYLHPGRRADADYSAMYMPVRPGASLLDVGCGAGQVLTDLVSLGWDGQGLDPDPVAVETARRNGLRAEVGTLEERAYPSSTFDAVVSSHVIEHVPDPRALLREIHRVLVPGGTCVIVTPNFDSWGRVRYGRRWRGLEPPRHLSLFHGRLLERIGEEAGFDDVRVSSTIRGAHEYFTASMTLESGGAAGEIVRWWARALQLAEAVLLKARPGRGEELVLVARKTT